MQLFYDLERSSHNLLIIEEEHGAVAVLVQRLHGRVSAAALYFGG